MTGQTAHGDLVQSDLTQEELEMIYYFLKRFFLGLLKQVEIPMMVYYIKENKAPNVQMYIQMIPKKVRRKASKIGEKNQELINKYITAEQMIEYCKESLPELYRVLSTQKGEKWLRYFVKYIKKSISEL